MILIKKVWMHNKIIINQLTNRKQEKILKTNLN